MIFAVLIKFQENKKKGRKRIEEKGVQNIGRKRKSEGNNNGRKALLDRQFTRKLAKGDSQKGRGIHLLLHFSETLNSSRSTENPACTLLNL